MFRNATRRLLAKLGTTQREPISLNLDLNQSSAEAFPNVPLPDPPLTPILLAARWISHDLHAEEMPGIAADLLEAGFDSPALRRLAGETQLCSIGDAEPLVMKVFRDLGIPSEFYETHAKLITSRQIAREVIAGKRDPYRAASHLEAVLWNWRPVTADLDHLFLVHDEFMWDAQEQRYLSALLIDQLQTFARLASLTDEQLIAEAKEHTPL